MVHWLSHRSTAAAHPRCLNARSSSRHVQARGVRPTPPPPRLSGVSRGAPWRRDIRRCSGRGPDGSRFGRRRAGLRMRPGLVQKVARPHFWWLALYAALCVLLDVETTVDKSSPDSTILYLHTFQPIQRWSCVQSPLGCPQLDRSELRLRENECRPLRDAVKGSKFQRHTVISGHGRVMEQAFGMKWSRGNIF